MASRTLEDIGKLLGTRRLIADAMFVDWVEGRTFKDISKKCGYSVEHTKYLIQRAAISYLVYKATHL